MDAFYANEIENTGDAQETFELAYNISQAVKGHIGPVYIVDQGWEPDGRDARARREVLENIKPVPVQWIQFDEDTDSWDDFLPALLKRLRKDHVAAAVVGGIWWDATLTSGCATTVYLFLRDHMPTEVDMDIVGCVPIRLTPTTTTA